MKLSRRPFFAPSAALAWLCLAMALAPSSGHAQPPRKMPTRPAAKPTASPSATPKPLPTPDIIPAAPGNEMKESSPPRDAVSDAPVSETEIDASEGATFASKDRIAVFSGNVRVTDPRFQLSCDKLTVFLNKSAMPDSPAAPSTSPVPGNTPPPSAGKKQGGGGGIDRCVAEGHVIILQKRAPTKPGEEEKISIGRAQKGTFDNKTGDMTLFGMPEIEQNGNSHSATSPETVMVIHKDSSLDTKGPNKTRLIQHKGSGGIEMPGVPTTPGDGSKPKKNKNGAGSPPAQG